MEDLILRRRTKYTTDIYKEWDDLWDRYAEHTRACDIKDDAGWLYDEFLILLEKVIDASQPPVKQDGYVPADKCDRITGRPKR